MMGFFKECFGAWKILIADIRQFLLDCVYAPLWLKITNGIWLAMLVALIWGGTLGVIHFYETTTIDPHSALGVLATFVMLLPVVAIFVVRSAYEWAATKILLHFGFIEQKE